jgi:hypothetical protein
MSDNDPQSESWRRRFEDIDRAPWPGPRPIIQDPESRLLHGRDSDAERFLAAVIDHLLVVLTADSGVGKSSLLSGRLRPDLDSEGFLVVYVDRWHLREGQTPAEYIGEHVIRQIGGEEVLGDPRADSFWSKVDREFGDRLVLILDQFEELVRFQFSAFERTREWIATLNRGGRIRVVISLRAEYHHQLRALERDTRPFTMTTHRLEPVSDEVHIEQLIKNFDPRVGGIEDGALPILIDLWRSAQRPDDRPGNRPDDRAGLLNLQSVLYVLHHRARSQSASLAIPIITSADVTRYSNDASAANLAVLEYGLHSAVETKLVNCRTAAQEVGLDRVLVDGTDALVRRIVANLSSGGFKLVLDEWTLAKQALRVELERTARAVTLDPKEMLSEVEDACFTREGEIVHAVWPGGRIDDRARWKFGPVPRTVKRQTDDGEWVDQEVIYHHSGWAPWYHDPRDISSGPMLGMPPDLVLFQELRRFSFAMRWLQESMLVRRSVPERGRTMVALIHDGFGRALERYAETASETFTHAMARLTGAKGDELHWSRGSIESFYTSIGGPGPHHLVNLRWRDCTVREVEFCGVVFVNGDFRGTRFERCVFEGATFVNCLLDNAMFSECDIVGRTSTDSLDQIDAKELTAGGDPEMPDFVVKLDPKEIALLEAYRGLEHKPGSLLYSRTSGVAAHPAAPEHLPPGIQWSPAARGLAVFGGRLSSLMFNGCNPRFVSTGESQYDIESILDSTLALRHIAGAALDLAEHTGGRLEIVDSILRGLTISAPEGIDLGGVITTKVEVAYAIMANVWIDADVHGSMRLRDTMVSQLVSCSPREQFLVELGSPEMLNVPVGVFPGVEALTGGFEHALDHVGGAVLQPPLHAFAAMDYRSRPAERELGGSVDEPRRRA